jgi:shikimate dehydrogenase
VAQRFAVVGNPIDHSLSPVIHQQFAKQTNIHLTYQKIKADESSFEQQITTFFAQDGHGLNITLPFKQHAYALAAHASERCHLAQAANTLWMQAGQLYADNTDGIGLIRDLCRYLPLSGKRVLILGAGGATRGIVHPLWANNLAALVLANRTAAKAEALQQICPQIKCVGLDELNEAFDLIINATSASLTGGFIALPESCFSTQPLCYDLSYKQGKATAFLHYARARDCLAVDGLGMLVEQAAEAFFIWHGIRPATQDVLSFLRAAL